MNAEAGSSAEPVTDPAGEVIDLDADADAVSDPHPELDGRDGADATGSPADARRLPKQQRSRDKVDAILDAADALITVGDADAVTTTLVAARAGVAVGSVYRYFDGVPAILEALTARHTERFAVYLSASLEGQRFVRKRDGANAALDALIDYYRADAGFRGLWRIAPRVTGAGFGEASDMLVDIIMQAMMAQGLFDHVDQDLAREAEIQWAIATALIEVAFGRDPKGDPTVLTHLRRCFDLDVRPVT